MKQRISVLVTRDDPGRFNAFLQAEVTFFTATGRSDIVLIDVIFILVSLIHKSNTYLFLLFHNSKRVRIFSFICSISACIFAKTITKVTNPNAKGQIAPIASSTSIVLITLFGLKLYDEQFF